MTDYAPFKKIIYPLKEYDPLLTIYMRKIIK